LSVTYELQDTNATAYPPTIQGRGANVYAIGVLCPNTSWMWTEHLHLHEPFLISGGRLGD